MNAISAYSSAGSFSLFLSRSAADPTQSSHDNFTNILMAEESDEEIEMETETVAGRAVNTAATHTDKPWQPTEIDEEMPGHHNQRDNPQEKRRHVKSRRLDILA